MKFRVLHEPTIQDIPAAMLRGVSTRVCGKHGRNTSSFEDIAKAGLTPEQILEVLGDPEEHRRTVTSATRRLRELVAAHHGNLPEIKERVQKAHDLAVGIPPSPTRNEIVETLRGALAYIAQAEEALDR